MFIILQQEQEGRSTMESVEQTLQRMNNEMNKKYYSLKEKQKLAIVSSKSRDVLAVLPTGYGKTVIIQVLDVLFIALLKRCNLITVVDFLHWSHLAEKWFEPSESWSKESLIWSEWSLSELS